MTFKKLALVFLLLLLTLPETFAKDYNFVLKENVDHGLYFILKLQDGDTIYSNRESDSNPFPTSIKIHPSRNLKNYSFEWPKAKSKYQDGIGEVEYFDNEIIIPLKVEVYNYSKPVKLKADIEFVVCNDQCVPVQQKLEEDLIIHDHGFSIEQYLWFVGIAILGGFILNFMPCVLPVLSLKILSFMKNDNIDRKLASILTIIGIFTCFWVLAGVMIILKHSGRQFGLGVNFQVPEFIIVLTLLITFFISLSLGRINFGMTGLGNSLNKIRFVNPYLEHYFSGIIATILSTPCNAPFIGSALAFAFGIGDNMVVLMFSAIAFGFSAPYFAIIFVPGILKFMPKPGVWMEAFKKFLAILLIGTIIWLLWVLSSQIGDRATFGLFLLLLLFKFSLETSSGFLRSKFSKIVLILTIITASMILPQYAHDEDEEHNTNVDIVWKKFEPNNIRNIVSQGNIVFVDITADWCATCKYNKIMVLDRERTLGLFQREKVIAMRGDFTSQDDEIYKFLTYYETIGIPFYIVYGPAKPEGIILPVIIGYNDIVEAIQKVKFLE